MSEKGNRVCPLHSPRLMLLVLGWAQSAGCGAGAPPAVPRPKTVGRMSVSSSHHSNALGPARSAAMPGALELQQDGTGSEIVAVR